MQTHLQWGQLLKMVCVVKHGGSWSAPYFMMLTPIQYQPVLSLQNHCTSGTMCCGIKHKLFPDESVTSQDYSFGHNSCLNFTTGKAESVRHSPREVIPSLFRAQKSSRMITSPICLFSLHVRLVLYLISHIAYVLNARSIRKEALERIQTNLKSSSVSH